MLRCSGGSRSTPCSLISLTSWGDVTVWTVSLLAPGDNAGGEMDLGLRIGSRVRLLRTASNVRLGMQALQKPGAMGLQGSLGAVRVEAGLKVQG